MGEDLTQVISISDLPDALTPIWEQGYSIAELWGHSKATHRGTSNIGSEHVLLWGILGIVEYQVDRGAGHRYLRSRLEAGDWVVIGYRAPRIAQSRLICIPKIENAKFGKKLSSIGSDEIQYQDIRVVHHNLLQE